MSLSSLLCESLRIFLPTEATRRFVIAYSGGIDSQVLLHLMADYVAGDKDRLLLAHVDHGLHEDSRRWSHWCTDRAAELEIEAISLKIDEPPPPGDSVEAWARAHRYRLLESVMHADDVLLTAHHRNDLVETFLLQLFRGAGPHGLASIGEGQRFGQGLLLRPLLNATRAEIEAYAEAYGLQWIEDPSNAEDRYDRNFLRNRVLPQIERRWPAVNARIAHAVELQQDAATLLDEAADAILDTALEAENSRLLMSSISSLSGAMQRSVLRRWIVRAGLPIPDAVHLQEMKRLVHARVDAQPLVCWKGAELRRYRDTLFLGWQTQRIAGSGDYHWDLNRPLRLPGGVLSASAAVGRGLRAELVACNDVVVRFRAGGERCHPADRMHSQSLKRLFQEWAIPPWLRSEVPLIFCGDELVAVAGYCSCRGFTAGVGEKGWELQWVRLAQSGRPSSQTKV